MAVTVMKAVTTRLQGRANALLEFYLGYKRMHGERVDKEDAVAQFVEQGVKASVPSDVLALFEKDERLPTKSRKATAAA